MEKQRALTPSSSEQDPNPCFPPVRILSNLCLEQGPPGREITCLALAATHLWRATFPECILKEAKAKRKWTSRICWV
jgi:hypothetical protein